jgi:hypothetical protein
VLKVFPANVTKAQPQTSERVARGRAPEEGIRRYFGPPIAAKTQPSQYLKQHAALHLRLSMKRRAAGDNTTSRDT